MDVSPFPHQGPLQPEEVRGRDQIVDELVERATERRVTALLGPRRFGKTSVLRKVESVVTEGGANVIWIDFYETRSKADVVVRLDEALAATRGPIRDALRSIASTLSLNLGVFKVQFAQKPSLRPDPDAALHLILDVLVKAALTHPTVVIIDEFSSINQVEGVAGMLRTKLQHHVREIGLLFAGSEPTAMASMFSLRDQPFYAQADLLNIEGFSPDSLAAIVREGFEATDRDPGDVVDGLHPVSEGHPYRAMQIADAAWRLCEPGQPAPDNLLASAFDLVRANTESALETLFSSFAPSEQSVLRSLQAGRPLFGGSLELLGSSQGGIAAARNRLIASGTISRDLRIVDPLLADWIRRRFPI
ncbi:MAG: ATP-binding protein [Acidimicrobiales bacterium]|nr:ATP-binding protein [Acidimicrobiales bacterium]